MIQLPHMEFEKNKPTTEQDIALADAHRVTLQPVHQDIAIEPLSMSRAQIGNGLAAFEQETTTGTSASDDRTGLKSSVVVIIACCIAIIFGMVLAFLYILRYT